MPRKKKKVETPAPMEGKQLEILAPFVTRLSLTMPEGFSETLWKEVGKALCLSRGAVAWWVGDWINQGEDQFRDEAIQIASDVLGVDAGTCTTYSSICRTFDVARRRTLSFEHHKEVRGLTHKEQDKWLDKAASFGWSKSELRQNIKESGIKQPQVKLELNNGPRRTIVELYEKFKVYMDQAPMLWEPLKELLDSIGEMWEQRLPAAPVLDMLEKTIGELLENLHRLQATTLELEKLEVTPPEHATP